MTEQDLERIVERNQLAIRALAVAIRELHVAIEVLNHRLGRPDEAIQSALHAAMTQLDRARL